MNSQLKFLIILGAVVVYVLGIFLAYSFERREWNHGVCRENGLPWVYFDSDSQGGRGYKAGDRFCWISCPWVDR